MPRNWSRSDILKTRDRPITARGRRYEGERVGLEFEGGISVEGDIITGTRNLQGKILLITFENCLVKHLDQVLFEPERGLYHMAVGQHIVSAFNGQL